MLLAALSACGPQPPAGTGSSTGEAETQGATPTSGEEPTTSGAHASTGAVGMTSGTTSTSGPVASTGCDGACGESTGVAPDMGAPPACGVVLQDCPRGQECVPDSFGTTCGRRVGVDIRPQAGDCGFERETIESRTGRSWTGASVAGTPDLKVEKRA
ncbi:MAG TPA: hypothetical protein VGB85_10615 [Nannocystis sp.]